MQTTTWRRFDVPFFLVMLVLMVVGESMIYSAYGVSPLDGGEPLWENPVVRQSVFGVIGLVVYLVVAILDYHILVSLSRGIYLFAIGILAITLAIGSVSFGARSWLAFQAFDIQPSELCKVLMIIVLARHLGREQSELENVRPLLVSAALLLAPVLLIYLQPDFGTALILLATWLGMVFLSGVRWRHLLLLVGIAAVIAPLAWSQIEGYMRDRILLFLFPDNDPSGASYNVTQALISIGSGGLWGKGFRQGTQSQLHFLRVRHTDFVFSVLAEEMGFVGATLMLALFAFLVLRLVRIANMAADRHGQLIVAGVASMVLAQTLINLGMNVNVLPVTGLPLPLVSYGGSSLLTVLFALGLAQSVAIRARPDGALVGAGNR